MANFQSNQRPRRIGSEERVAEEVWKESSIKIFSGKFSSFCSGFGVGLPPRPTAHLSSAVCVSVEPPPANAEEAPSASLALPRDLADPLGARVVKPLKLAQRSGESALRFERVCLLDISKRGGKEVLGRISQRLCDQPTTRVSVRRYCKRTFSRPMHAELRREIRASGCSSAVLGLAD